MSAPITLQQAQDFVAYMLDIPAVRDEAERNRSLTPVCARLLGRPVAHFRDLAPAEARAAMAAARREHPPQDAAPQSAPRGGRSGMR